RVGGNAFVRAGDIQRVVRQTDAKTFVETVARIVTADGLLDRAVREPENVKAVSARHYQHVVGHDQLAVEVFVKSVGIELAHEHTVGGEGADELVGNRID